MPDAPVAESRGRFGCPSRASAGSASPAARPVSALGQRVRSRAFPTTLLAESAYSARRRAERLPRRHEGPTDARAASEPIEADVLGRRRGAVAARPPRTGSRSAATGSLVVEKKRFPREKTCGDGLTPRAVRQLRTWGSASALVGVPALRRPPLDRPRGDARAGLARPPRLPAVRLRRAAPRPRRDGRRRAVKAGATLWPAAEAVEPIVEGGLVTGAVVQPQGRRHHRGGAGPLRGRRRRRELPLRPGARRRPGPHLPAGHGGARATSAARCHDEPWIESHLDLRDEAATTCPGYGWIFPVGDGTVNVGVGLLSTFSGWKDVNTSHLMDAFCETAPARWGIRPDTALRRADRRASCRPAFSVKPRSGRPGSWSGDAAGSVNPFNGEGISVAYETGRLAADAIDQALAHRRRPRAADATRSASTRCTASTSRWPARSCGRSATRR